MLIPGETRCCEMVWDQGGWRRYPCTRNATVERDGEPYCGQHDPEKVAARKKARTAIYEAKCAAREREHNRRIVAQEGSL